MIITIELTLTSETPQLYRLFSEYEIWVSNAVTEASINFDSQAVPVTLNIECDDGTSTITDTFDVNIVDSVIFCCCVSVL